MQARAETRKYMQRQMQREQQAKTTSPYRFHRCGFYPWDSGEWFFFLPNLSLCVPRRRLEVLQQTEPVPGVPPPEAAMAYLERLSTDPGIRAIMEKYQWSVGVLKEFAPSLETGIVGITEGCLLGYNQNKGQVIALRLRTGE